MRDPKGRLLAIVMINTFDYLLGMDIERREGGGEGRVHHTRGGGDFMFGIKWREIKVNYGYQG